MFTGSFTFSSHDDKKIFVYKWLPERRSMYKGIVQIAHGMAEHALRYERFAMRLVADGYIVYASDQRGHGKTAGSPDKAGVFSHEDSWDKLIDDLFILTKIVKKDYSHLPFFLFGHSMGSLLVRNYIYKYGKHLDGAIISGAVAKTGVLMDVMARLVAKIEVLRKGRENPSPLLHKMAFASNNKPFSPCRTECDWLSRDKEEVDKYLEDPYCGKVLSAGFYQHLLKGLKEVNKMENIKKIPVDLPVFILSGSEDPVGGMDAVIQVYRDYKKAGLTELDYKIYDGGRHEMLNEVNRDQVMEDIISWLNYHR